MIHPANRLQRKIVAQKKNEKKTKVHPGGVRKKLREEAKDKESSNVLTTYIRETDT